MKIIAGSVFALAAAILYSMKYLSAAVYVNNLGSYSQDEIAQAMEWVNGSTFNVLAGIALAIGLVFIVWGLVESVKSNKKTQ